MKKTLLTFACMVLSCAIAIATDQSAEVVDFGVMELNTPYEFECKLGASKHTVQGQFTAPKDMLLEARYAVGTQDVMWPYKEAEHTSQYDCTLEAGNIYMAIPLKKDQTVYFCTNPLIKAYAPFTVMLTDGASSMTLDETYPEAGTLISVGNGMQYQAQFHFSSPITAESAEISGGGKTVAADVIVYEHIPRIAVVNIKEGIASLLKDGTLKANDEVTVSVKGVRGFSGDLFGADGTVSVTYKVMAMPIHIVSESTGEGESIWNEFNAYYYPESQNGLLKIEFSEPPLGTIASALTMGEPSNPSTFFQEDLKSKISVEGNVLTIDLRGVKRFYQDILPNVSDYSDPLYEYMAMSITGIKGADGQNLLTNDYATEGARHFSFKFMNQNETLPTVEYTILPSSTDPEDMGETEKLEQIAFTFDEDVYLHPDMANVQIKNAIGNATNGVLTMSDDQRTLIFTPEEPITDYDTYKLTVKEGTVGDAAWQQSGYITGKANSQFSTSVVVIKRYPPLTMDFVPERTDPPTTLQLTMLRVFRLFFDEKIYYNYIRSTLSFKDENGNDIPCSWEALGDEDVFQIEVRLDDPIETSGSYTLTLPEANFGNKTWRESDYTGGRCNPELSYTWKIQESGIETISADDAAASDSPIYNLQGIRVPNPTQGLYIKDGKKILVK